MKHIPTICLLYRHLPSTSETFRAHWKRERTPHVGSMLTKHVIEISLNSHYE